jgi:hypothetical protein
LNELSWLRNFYKDEHWLVVGDFNAHIGLLGEDVNGKLVRDWLIDEDDMTLKNLEVTGVET